MPVAISGLVAAISLDPASLFLISEPDGVGGFVSKKIVSADVLAAGDITLGSTALPLGSTVTTVAGLTLGSPVLTGTPTAPTAAPGTNSTQIATTAYADAASTAIIAAADAMVFKGVIDCSANPNYPAANRGETYRVSVAGKIGGASGLNVEVGDLLLCLTDGTASGTQAAVGAQWSIVQTNLDGAVIGPASAVDSRIAAFDGTSGKLLKDGGIATSALLVTGGALGTLGSTAFNQGATLTTITGLTLSGGTLSGTTTLTGMTPGSILFSGTSNVLSQDNANLFWDDTNNRLGIGTASPSLAFVVSGAGQPGDRIVTTDSTTTSAAFHSALADNVEIDLIANAIGRTTVRYGITLGGWAEVSTFNGLGGAGTPANGMIIGVAPNKPLVFGTNNAERARIDGSGNFGIRNILPQAMLHVGTTAGSARIYNAFTDPSNGEWSYMGGFAANVSTFGTDKNGTGVARDVSFLYGGTEYLRLTSAGITLPGSGLITSGGALGIGATPVGSLYVQGSSASTFLATTMATGTRSYIVQADLTANNMSRLVFAGLDTGGTARNAAGITAILTHNATSVDGELAFQTAVAGVSAERLRIGTTLYSGYQLLLGNLSSTAMTIAGVSNQGFQIASTGGSSRINNIRYSADVTAPAIFFAKSRGTLPTAGAVVSGDALMEIRAVADDGSTNSAVTITSAYFQALVDGTVSTGVVPSRFSWSVTSAAGALAERMRLSAAGNLGIGNTDPQARLSIGTASNPGTARTYNTYTDLSNGEWALLGNWASNVAQYGSDKNGTGTTRDVTFLYGGSEYVRLSSSGINFTGLVLGNATTGNKLVDQIYDHDLASTAQLDATSNTVLATVTGLSAALAAGKTYYIDGWLSTTANASGGLKAALIASGGLTVTSCRFQALAFNGTTLVANTTVTALGSNIVANTAVITDVYIRGSIVVNVAGTINVQAAQNASFGTATSVFAGSIFAARRTN